MIEKKSDDRVKILLSWIAIKNDPFDSDDRKKKRTTENAERELGPTLSLLFDEESPYCGKIDEILFLHRAGKHDAEERKALDDTIAEIAQRQPSIRVHRLAWKADDPTDHRAIFQFLRDEVVPWRRRCVERPLIIHISPGAPAMQTVFVLMTETGLIPGPCALVQSYRREDRHGRAAAVQVDVGVETFYKAYLASRPKQSPSPEQTVVWDPAQFRSPRLKELYEHAQRFAQLQVPVLILGERGTGKTTLAAWLRKSSPFHRPELDSDWLSVACGQYTPETMRAELFGHTVGAFTDAKQARPGLLAAAHKDTLFLDEIGDISVDVQRLLIKALEEKKYQRLGDTKYQRSDFRLLCATNLPLVDLRQRLAADFWDRVSVFQLRLPSLRDIPDDLDWLWARIYAQAVQRSGVSVRQTILSESHHAMIVRALRDHPLPGNLRDLLRVAYHLLAARADAVSPMQPKEAITYALGCLCDTETEPGHDVAREVARSFATHQPLDGLLGTERLNTREVLSAVQQYLASELRRIASDRRVSVKSLCDKTERTLLTWDRAKK